MHRNILLLATLGLFLTSNATFAAPKFIEDYQKKRITKKLQSTQEKQKAANAQLGVDHSLEQSHGTMLEVDMKLLGDHARRTPKSKNSKLREEHQRETSVLTDRLNDSTKSYHSAKEQREKTEAEVSRLNGKKVKYENQLQRFDSKASQGRPPQVLKSSGISN